VGPTIGTGVSVLEVSLNSLTADLGLAFRTGLTQHRFTESDRFSSAKCCLCTEFDLRSGWFLERCDSEGVEGADLGLGLGIEGDLAD